MVIQLVQSFKIHETEMQGEIDKTIIMFVSFSIFQ